MLRNVGYDTFTKLYNSGVRLVMGFAVLKELGIIDFIYELSGYTCIFNTNKIASTSRDFIILV